MKMTKRELNLYPFYDFTGIGKHLEKMVEQGWMLEKQTPMFWYYRRTEPTKVHFSVSYFAKASEFDPEPCEEQKLYQDYCTAAGWKLVSRMAQMQIYMNEAEDPVPIETDAKIQVTNISHAMKKNFVVSQILIFLMALTGLGLNVYQLFDRPTDFLVNNLSLMSSISWVLLAVQAITLLVGYLRWIYYAKKMAEQEGELRRTNGHIGLQYTILILICLSFLITILSYICQRFVWVILFGLASSSLILYLVYRIKNLMKKHQVSKGVNRTITILSSILLTVFMLGGMMVGILLLIVNGFFAPRPVDTYVFHGLHMDVYKDQLPFELEDIMEVDSTLYSKELTQKSTVFLSQTDVRQFGRLDAAYAPNLEYTITRIHAPFIYTICLNDLLNRYTYSDVPEEYQNKYIKINDDRWDADAVYQFYSGGSDASDWYYICWEDKIVEIHLFWKPTDDQIRVIAQKLKSL